MTAMTSQGSPANSVGPVPSAPSRDRVVYEYTRNDSSGERESRALLWSVVTSQLPVSHVENLARLTMRQVWTHLESGVARAGK